MDNKVVHTLFKALLELGFVTVKFNFRGVGKSEGVYGEGVGETEDVITVVEALQKQFDAKANNLPLLLAVDLNNYCACYFFVDLFKFYCLYPCISTTY